MDEKHFWKLIEDSHHEDPDTHADNLGDVLEDCTVLELVSFDRIYHEKINELRTWDLWGVAWLLLGGASDDSFDYFCDYILGQGQLAHKRAQTHPEDVGLALCAMEYDGDFDSERLRYAAVTLIEEYTTLTGEPVELSDVYSAEPTGEEWDEDELFERFPRLARHVS